MGVISSAITTAGGAWQSKEYGVKGMVAGGAAGLLGDLGAQAIANQFKDEEGNDTLASSMMYGFVNGSVQSGISTTQEILSYHNPHKVFAASSVNSTTTATAGANFIANLMDPKSYKRAKNYYNMTIGMFEGQEMPLTHLAGVDTKQATEFMNNMKSQAGTVGKMFGLSEDEINSAIGGIDELQGKLGDMNKSVRKAGALEKIFAATSALSMEYGTHLFTPENFLTDITKEAMIMDTNEASSEGFLKTAMEELQGKFADKAESFGKVLDGERPTVGGVAGGAKDSILGAGKFIKDDLKHSIDAYNGKSKWFKNEDYTLDVNGKTVELKKGQSVNERMAEFVLANREEYDKVFTKAEQGKDGIVKMMTGGKVDISKYKQMLKEDPQNIKAVQNMIKENDAILHIMQQAAPKGTLKDEIANLRSHAVSETVTADDFIKSLNNTRDGLAELTGVAIPKGLNSTDEYVEYLRSIKPGARGTEEALRNAGFYDKGTPFRKKAAGLIYEGMNGSPVWSRTINKQIEKGVVKEVRDAAGKVHLNGGGKIGRALAIVADTVLIGGGVGALAGGAAYAAQAPFHKRKETNELSSNTAYNAMGE